MATKTIHTTAYKLLVDNTQFDKGMTASRREINQAKKVMSEVLTPAERMEVEFAKLGALLKKGAIDQDVFNRKAQSLRATYQESSEAGKRRAEVEKKLQQTMETGRSLTKSLMNAEERHAATLAKNNRLLKAGAITQETYNRAMIKSRDTLPAVIAAKKKLADAEKRELERVKELTERRRLYGIGLKVAAVAIGAKVVQNLDRQIDRIDDLGKASEKLGASTEFLTRLQFAAGRTSGLADDATVKGIEKMTRRISEAAAGGGEAVGVLNELGLSARKLSDSGPEKAFLMIARAMDGVTAEHDRLRIATKLFDDEQAGIHTTLRLSNAELQKQFDLADRLGRTVSGLDASNAAVLNDTFSEISSTFNSMSMELATNFAPAISTILSDLNEAFLMITTNNGGQGIDYETNFGDGLAAISRSGINFSKNLITNFTGGEFEPGSENGYTVNPFTNTSDIRDERVNKQAAAMRAAEKARSDRERAVKQREAESVKEMAAAAEKTKASKAAEMADKNRIAKEQALAKVMERGRSITQSLMTEREREMEQMREYRRLLDAKAITEETYQRAVAKNIKQKETETETVEVAQRRKVGPGVSIAARSSEAFRLSNQITTVKSVEAEQAKQQTKIASDQLAVLSEIRGTLQRASRRDQSKIGGA